MAETSASLFKNLRVDQKQDCPISVQIADQIRWLIVTNQINPGFKLPPVRELADQLNVNLHTIRSAYQRLEERNLINTRRGFGSVVIEYEPSDTIPLHSPPTHTFGVIVPDLGNPFYPAFLKGAACIGQEKHLIQITCDTQGRSDLGKAFFEMLITKHVDGMIIAPWGMNTNKDELLKEEFYDYPIPIVFVDRPDIKGYSVLIDSKNSGFTATQHLIEHGHKEVAIVTGTLSSPTLNQVFQGYCSALKENGISYEEQLVIEVNEFSYKEGYRCTKHMINSGHLPPAIFMAGDMFAVGALKAFREHGIKVPEDVAIVGYNNIDVAEYMNPSLTTVTTPIQQLGEKSAEMLYKLINHEPVVERHIKLPSKLIIRESCGCAGIRKEL